jgi:hypothetical protein
LILGIKMPPQKGGFFIFTTLLGIHFKKRGTSTQ